MKSEGSRSETGGLDKGGVKKEKQFQPKECKEITEPSYGRRWMDVLHRVDMVMLKDFAHES